MIKVSGAWLNNSATQKVAQAFSNAGYQIFFVGGCVRNALMEVAVTDIDMATDARPEIAIKLCNDAGFKTIPTGIDHGTITVVASGIPHEITTFRKDLSTNGRHAEVAFSGTMADDASRRDFTMNALYAEPSGILHDPVHGMPDLKARRVRFIGDPDLRINEDYLRILRFFRFYAWYGDPAGGLDAEGLAACAKWIEGLEGLSRERIGAEMIKLLSAPDPAPAIAAMAQSGVLNAVMPGADPKALAPLVHFEGSRGTDWRRRAAVLGGEDPRTSWRLAKKDATHLATLTDSIGSPDPVAHLAYLHGPDLAINSGLARAALFETPPADTMDHDITTASQSIFPVKAVDLPTLSGAALGEKLRGLEQDWISSGFSLTKDELLAL